MYIRLGSKDSRSARQAAIRPRSREAASAAKSQVVPLASKCAALAALSDSVS
jgi:hypothetical protein